MIKTSKKLLIFLLAAIMMQSCSSGTVDETTKAGTESGKTETTAESESETETEPEETYTDDICGPNLLRSIVTASDQSYDIVTMLDRYSLTALSEKLIVSYRIRICRTLTSRRTAGVEICSKTAVSAA